MKINSHQKFINKKYEDWDLNGIKTSVWVCYCMLQDFDTEITATISNNYI